MKLIATCKLGLESLVARELQELNLTVDAVLDARVTFFGDSAELFRSLLWLRTAERVFVEVATFEAKTFDELFEGVKAADWKRYLQRDANIHVTGKSAKSTLFSVSDCQSITKKAIIENLKQAYNTTVIKENGPEVIVEVGILKDMVTLAIDCCGAGLSRRGYRTYNVAAPLSETLGAAIVTLARYRADLPLIDPMCGSGTMPIEAAMMANNIAPGLNREFAAQRYHQFLDVSAFDRELEAARDGIQNNPIDILGSDIDPRSIDLAKKHAKKAGVMLKWNVSSVHDIRHEAEHGIIVCNPPYGERMLEKKETEKLYKEMFKAFDRMTGWSKHIITSHREFEKLVGKRADKRRKLSNGGMQTTLYQYFWK